MLFKTRSVTEGFTEYSESSQNLAVMSTIEKLRTPSFRLFQIVSIFFRAARPPGVGVTGPGTRGLPSRAFACTRETPEPRRGQNQRSGHAADCHDGRRRIRDRAVQARGRWQQ